MKILRADAMGMCFGVRDALAVTEDVEHPARVTIYGELVHNQTVMVQLDTRGFLSTPEDNREVPETEQVLITAHGISEKERSRLEHAGKTLIDTTCPLVTRVHQAARSLAEQEYHVLVIGKPGHVEVRGITEDLESFDVIPTAEDVRCYPEEKLGIVCQTTTPPRVVEEIETAVRNRNSHAEIRFVNTVCQPTRDRQQAMERLLRTVDTMVVVGGTNSNNTKQLVKLSEERGIRAFHIQSAGDLQREWFTASEIVGLTAGTSTLESTIQSVYESLCEIARQTVVKAG